MRPVTAHLFSSIDGAVESPNLWQFDAFDAELGQAMGAALAATDAVILGRTTYQEWAGYWATAGADDPFASFINPVPKYVASRTLTGDLEWQNSTVIEGDLLEFVRALKQTAGKNIAVNGSISVVRQLFLAGLIDELTLTVHPVVAGSGMQRLFEPDTDTTRLELINGTTTSAGNAMLTYRLRG